MRAGSSPLRNSSGSAKGGWQVNPEHKTANGLPEFNCGRFGIVAASAGGRLPATAWFNESWSTLLLKANGADATLASAEAVASDHLSAITTTCTEGSNQCSTAIP